MRNLFELKKDGTTYIKGIAILFVVLGHLGYFYRVAAEGVILFLAVSGYGLVVSWQQKGIKEFWKKKIIGVYIPYVLVSLVKILATPNINTRQVVLTLVGGGTSDNIDGTMWYISYIFFWYFAFWLIATICEKVFKWEPSGVNARIALVACIGVIAYRQFVISTAVNVLWHGSSGANMYAFSFLAGVLMAGLRDVKLKREWVSWIYAVGTLVALSAVFRLYGRCDTMLKCMLFDYCVAGFVIVISLYKDKLFKNAIIKIGEMSFAIYLVEGYVINNRATLLYFLEDGLVRNVGCAVVVLMVGFAVHQIVNNCITENDIVAKRGET